MYERNINVLEMFLEKKLGYVETNNIKNNYYDYKDLVKALDDYINICNEETKAKHEYEEAVTYIENIQKTQEKVYNQNVKFEYSRNILFSDINRKVEDIEKCLVKIENALDKNKDTFKTLRKNFIQGIINLNEKERNLKKLVRPKHKIEADYKNALSLIQENYYSINPDDILLARKFVESSVDFEEEIVDKIMNNGKNEKVPFNLDAIVSATKLGLDIAQKEAENYLFMYDQTTKILGELEDDKLKIEARKKHIVDVGVKLSFLEAEKDYLVQFLDNERVTAIQGIDEHDRLMKNCCSILKDDVKQINTLYDLIIKETKRRATNKCYEELYNKSYLENIQAKEKEFIEQTSNLNYANGTIISPNYWRIDSIKAIYDNFNKSVYENYGRKFVAPDQESEQKPQILERVVERVVEKVVEKPVEKIIERIVEKPSEQITLSDNSTTQSENVQTSTQPYGRHIARFTRVKNKNILLSDALDKAKNNSKLNNNENNQGLDSSETTSFLEDNDTLEINQQKIDTFIQDMKVPDTFEEFVSDSNSNETNNIENTVSKKDKTDESLETTDSTIINESNDIDIDNDTELNQSIEQALAEIENIEIEELNEKSLEKPKKTRSTKKVKEDNTLKLEKTENNKKISKTSKIENTDNLSDESKDIEEESMFNNSKVKNEEEEIEDLESIIREAENDITKHSKKAKNIIKKMVTKKKGKYAEE